MAAGASKGCVPDHAEVGCVLARVAPGWQMICARPNAPGEYQDTLHLALAALSMAPKLHTLGTDAVCPTWQAQLSLPAFVYLYIKYIP